MASFTVQLTKPAVKDLEGLTGPIRSGVLNGISLLQDDPLSGGQNVKKLKGFAFPIFRLRCGDQRILYRIDHNVVTIMRVIDRKDLEKTIKRLKLTSGNRH